MAKPTLTVQLMHANIRIAELEAENADLRSRATYLENQARLVEDRRERPVAEWKVTSDRRRNAAKRFFAAHPGARSVTDAELREFA